MIGDINAYLIDALENDRFLDGRIKHMPCLAHVIQLALKAFLGKIRLRPTNETFIRNWEEEQELNDLQRIREVEKRGIPYVLAKVCSIYLLY
jgi:hypothetical protein